jgi:Flp pilus assembly protein TadG
VEFTLVSILVLVLFLGVLQLGFALHVRNTLQAAASDGARHGGAAGRDPSDAAARTRELIDRALAARFADGVSADRETVDGIATVVVDVRAVLPMLGPWGPAERLHVRAHAFAEDG